MGAPHAAVGRRLLLAGHFAEPVVVESVDDYGDVVSLRVRTARGEPKDTTIRAAELLEALQTAESIAVGAFVDPRIQFMLVESARIRLAYAWDPLFAVSLSGIE